MIYEAHDEAITEIKVDMDTNGNLDRNLTIESMYNVDTMSTNVYALIGEPFNFTPDIFMIVQYIMQCKAYKIEGN